MGWENIFSPVGEKEDNLFGSVVAISGNYAIVGAYAFDGPDGGDQGKVYWYERQRNGEWIKVQTQLGENSGDLYGWSVSISGSYVIVGAPNFESGDRRGKAYWYERQNGKWTEVYYKIGENENENFGRPVAISGNYAMVSSTGVSNLLGTVIWYERQNDGKWKEVFSKSGEELSVRKFGTRVKISGNYAIIGASGISGNPGKNFFYERQNDGKWKEVQIIPGPGIESSISGNYMVIGDVIFEGPAGEDQGKVDWYEREKDGKWVKIQTQLGENSGDKFGDAVAISGNYAIVGAYLFGSNNNGKIYLYEKKKDKKWVKVHTQTGETINTNDHLGTSVAISGNYAMSGTPRYNVPDISNFNEGRTDFFLKKC